jgi:hypothetical protein
LFKEEKTMVVTVELDLSKISPEFWKELAKQISDSKVLSILAKDNELRSKLIYKKEVGILK